MHRGTCEDVHTGSALLFPCVSKCKVLCPVVRLRFEETLDHLQAMSWPIIIVSSRSRLLKDRQIVSASELKPVTTSEGTLT
eukprot:2954141-Amphidinium_carterae.1